MTQLSPVDLYEKSHKPNAIQRLSLAKEDVMVNLGIGFAWWSSSDSLAPGWVARIGRVI